MFDKKIIVSGVVMKLRPYTEKRFKELLTINEEIQKFIEDNPDAKMADITENRAQWYLRKSQILWEPQTPIDIEFFKSEDFEVSLLKETEDFFLKNAIYL
jgi:hypothetical protein